MAIVHFIALGGSLVVGSLYWLLRARHLADDGRRIVHPATTRVALTLLITTLVVAIYAWLGNVDAMTPPPADPIRALAEERTQRLATRLEVERDDVRGLRLLARSYEELRRLREAIGTRERLLALQPDDADALVDLAETVAMTQGGSLVGEPIALVRRALVVEPNHPRALAWAANEAAARDDLPAAIGYWERLALQTPSDSELARSVRSNIDRASSAIDAPARTTRR